MFVWHEPNNFFFFFQKVKFTLWFPCKPHKMSSFFSFLFLLQYFKKKKKPTYLIFQLAFALIFSKQNSQLFLFLQLVFSTNTFNKKGSVNNQINPKRTEPLISKNNVWHEKKGQKTMENTTAYELSHTLRHLLYKSQNWSYVKDSCNTSLLL